MSIPIEQLLLVISLLLFISILAGKTSYRLGIPTLLLFLLIGMLAGSEGLGRIPFDDPGTAKAIGIIALNYILFSGGFDTSWKSIRPVIGKGVMLSTFGVVFTALLVALPVWHFTSFSFLESLLLGAIVSSTDAAAVFSILRSKSVSLKGQLRPTLELESGSNDPMAYFLTVSLISIIQAPDKTLLSIIPLFFLQFSIGAVMGFGLGKLGQLVINRIKLDYEGLYPVLALALVILTFSATQFLNGNGFLAVYICGVFLGNRELIHKKSLIKFFDGIAWLMQIILFLTLGLLVYPSQMIPLIIPGVLISLFLIFFARPVAVMLSLSVFKMHMRDRLFISWVGLRGAVPIVFATYPTLIGLEKAQIIFNLVFFITIISVIVQGTSLPLVSKLLRVALPHKLRRRTPADIELSDTVKSELIEVDIEEDSPAAGKKIVDLGFPKTALIVMIKRHNKFLTPNGNTFIYPGDKLMVLAETSDSLSKALELVCPFPSTEPN
ncbi:potassium/proton antiporter [Alkalitalea saponilacus]|uniref:Cell volume regulation protein A n=1 Tax=Alkalitalea saponilacus TaxID=889453 RepID=A0A1T5HNQ9_9BACT|nr:potassium/proton antiporter [Alkalitalea saponilacus]ASB49346.1 K+/H+ antiporter [Alkalitalea saponilacus]SKC22170.1 cell volume regulation protein A [Alkalitalea saponilacus]